MTLEKTKTKKTKTKIKQTNKTNKQTNKKPYLYNNTSISFSVFKQTKIPWQLTPVQPLAHPPLLHVPFAP